MKLMRVGPVGSEKPAMLDEAGSIRDLSSVIQDISPTTISAETLDQLRRVDPSTLPMVSGDHRIGPCVGDVRRFFCIGLNYSDHAIESNLPIPDFPIVFMKVCEPTGPNDPVSKPKNATRMDWEVELGVVIGKEAKHVSEDDALSYVAGYCVVDDLSERSFQNEFGGQWVKGKSCDGFGPIGPYLVTADEVSDPQNLDLKLSVNGQVRQNGSTKTMIFSVAQIISHLSSFISLKPGDVISTGTPPGVGMGMTPAVYLDVGDTIEVSIAGLGQQKHIVAP